MKLVVLGKESLDELTTWAVELFSEIKNKHTAIPSFPGHPITSTQCQVIESYQSYNFIDASIR